ncbi:MAG TPA: OstA-like protein, partial [Ferruginibacter sp.]|nr:OstA-like protein [Ferruginibacter sp.]
MNKLFVSLFICTAFLCQQLHAQKPVEITPVTDTISVVDILHADRIGSTRRDTANIVEYAAGKVHARQGTTLFDADSAMLNRKLRLFEAFGNVHINDNDSTNTYSQYLRYYFDKKIALLQKNVRLTDGKSTITTPELEYDMNQKIGIYRKGGRVVNGESVLTSEEGTYYADLKDVFFRKKVVLVDPKYKLYADSLLYNTQTGIATFIDKTTIIDSSGRKIVTSEGFYDTKNRVANFLGRPVIRDPKARTFVTGNELYTDDEKGISVIKGNAVYIDTAQGISTIAGEMISDRKNNTLLATSNPLMIIKQDKDSIYVTADTLFSGIVADSLRGKDTVKGVKAIAVNNNNDSSNRYFQGYHHVRIFSDSLQAVADSMIYYGTDSIFRLFKNPVVWANGNQITGDTIYLYTKNKKPERLLVFENAMIVNRSDEGLYNQIKGNTITGYFRDGNIDFMRVKGTAESIYYVRDEDSAYVGVNRSTADIINLYFKDKALNRVVY